MRKLIEKGIRDNSSSAAIARTIQADPSGAFDAARANRIARTETTGALNGGAHAARQELYDQNVITAEEWLAVLDDFTRSDHQFADGGQKSKLGFFQVGNEQARFPGDPNLSAGNRINCRCTVLPIPAEITGGTPPPPGGEAVATSATPPLPTPEVPPTTSTAALPEEFGERMLHNLKNDPKLQAKLEKVQKINKFQTTQQASASIESEITALQERRAILTDEWVAGGANDPVPEPMKQLSREIQKLIEKVQPAEREAVRNAVLDIVKPPNPIGNNMKTTTEFLPNTVRKKPIKDVEAWYKKVLDGTATESDIDVLRVEYHRARSQGSPTNRAFQRGRDEVHLAPSSKPNTIAHEIGHVLEEQMKNANEAARKFLAHRTAGETPTQLKSLFPRSNYKTNEFGREDKWLEAFGDDRWYVGKDYPGGATEIISMGVEKFYIDPVGFAQKDPEFCKFIMGILDGSLLL